MDTAVNSKKKSDETRVIWLKRIASAIGVMYAVYICIISYRSLFYEVVVTKPVMFYLYITLLSVFTLAAMLYSRRQVLTRIASFVIVPALLPIVITCMGKWGLIIPIAVCAVVSFFASGASEGTKTLLGTIFLMVYILTALVYFIFTSYLASSAVRSTIETGTSPSEKYRYEVINTADSSNGSTTVFLEPNDRDIVKASVTYKIKGCKRTLCVKRPVAEVKIEWKGDDMYINGERWFTPSQAKKGGWFEQDLLSDML